jgi:hypothetical protein
MSSTEGSAQTLQPRDEPTASATNNSAKAANWWIWARLVAVVVFIVLVLAVFFAAGFYTGRHYGPHYRQDFLVPMPGQANPCSQLVCQPVGPKGGATCYPVRTC